MTLPAILTITLNPALDITTTTGQLVPARKLRCSTPRYDAGGGGVNVSRAIGELGGASRAFVAIGGPTGEQYAALLSATNVDALLFHIADNSRFSLTVMEATSGQHFRFVLPGPTTIPAEVQGMETVIGDAISAGSRFVVASGSLPPDVPTDFYGRIARSARKAGAALILDTSGNALTAALAERPYCVRINHHEARELVGGDDPIEAADALARQLVNRKSCEIAVITIGDQGAIVASKEGIDRITPPHVEVRSTVGAGDSFVAALTLGLSRRWPLEKAARYGVAAAAAAVTTEATELCKRTDVERYFTSMTRATA
jgi:6-phosphofructokinase 2